MSYFTRTENPGRPTIVVLCGSTRFSDAFREANLRETLAGRIVLSIGCNMRTDPGFMWMDEAELKEIKVQLDELHKRKIDLADEVLVLNVHGYIGDSTRSEIDYARKLGKPIRFLEPDLLLEEFSELVNARIQFWICPDRHPDRRDDKGFPLPTVEWRGDVAHCLEPGCGKTSAVDQPVASSVVAVTQPAEEIDKK